METKLPEFTLPVARDDHDRKLLSDVDTAGWHVLHILADARGPAFSFSVGLYYTYGHPEILIMGLEQTVAHKFLNLAFVHIADGRRFQPHERVSDLAEGYDCMFVPVGVEHYEDYLGYGIWFYRSLPAPFPTLQLVWPDKAGRFPWEAGYDARYSGLQKVLGERP